MNKYRNKRTQINDITFASKKEAKRYLDLIVMQNAKAISCLRLQPRYVLVVLGVKVCTYVADFEYIENGKVIAEDVKGVKTDVYKLKSRLFRVLYPDIELREI